MKNLDALHLVFLGIDDAQGALIAALQEITYDSATGLMDIIRATDDDNGLRVQQFTINHTRTIAFTG